ncbi:MAG TPA: hypothetical protein VN328_05590, partial [Thermodesulfovibrionales bacterium]|nr:hypothetical protein [Thermodesulfovibrionales bacterium]
RVTDKPRSRGNGSAQAQQVSPVQPASRLVQPSPSVASPQTRANEARKRREAVRNTPGNVKN